MWPATVVAGMLLLLGAIGSMGATSALAEEATVDDGEVCNIFGPFPTLEADAGDLDGHDDDIEGKLLVGESYLIIGVIQDEEISQGIDELAALIDDEEGDADIIAFADDEAGVFTSVPSVDAIDGLAANFTVNWAAAVVDEADSFFPTGTDLTDFADSCGDADDPLTPAIENPDGLALIIIECDDAGRFELTFFNEGNPSDSHTHEFLCVGDATTATLTAVPTSVESVPAAGNISHSLLVLVLTDADGNPAAPGQTVDWSTDRCRIDGLTEAEYEVNAPGVDDISAAALFAGFTPSTASVIETNLSGHGGLTGTSSSTSFENDPAGALPPPIRTIAAAILHCEGAAPGVANIVAEIERSGPDLRATATVTVVGPPAFITITAAPNRLVCGEKATILVTVTDAINQRVSDHTRVELITNFGGVIGGTGGTLGFPGQQPVSPLSSAAAETFGGVATAYLLTSTQHVGAYEVVAASGGSALGGIFSTPVVTSQVTVTCTVGAPTTTAPSTGTGSITPPSTGDAGLAAASSSSAMLFVIAGAVAFALAGLASYGYARR
jgi:hypothetical protein